MSYPLQKLGKGYPDLAKIMGPHTGMGLFKRFASLNAKNTLYMQVELLDLEQQLEDLEDVDKEHMRLPYYRDAHALINSESEGLNSDQWHLVLTIREKLQQYSKPPQWPFYGPTLKHLHLNRRDAPSTGADQQAGSSKWT